MYLLTYLFTYFLFNYLLTYFRFTYFRFTYILTYFLFTYLFTYLRPIYLFSYLLTIYLFIYLYLTATPLFPASREFCTSDNGKTTWSGYDGIVMHCEVPMSFKNGPILTG